MIFLVFLVLVGYGHAHRTMQECDGRTVGLHTDCAVRSGPLVPGQTLGNGRAYRFGIDLNDPRLWASPEVARCVANPHLCEP